MTRKRPRNLTPGERELWNEVKRSAIPLRPNKPDPKPETALGEPPKVAKKPAKPQKPKYQAPMFGIGEKSTGGKPVEKPQAPLPPSMDGKAYSKLKRGKLRPESRIDLHGMTVARAHGVLTTFIQDSHARGLRLVLVITGKGKDKDDGGPIPVPTGILRRQVPMWLAAPPLSAMVLQTSEAHLRHGGAGALYVYLRRRR